MNKTLVDTYESLKKITFNTSLMVQSDVNSLLYQLDNELNACIKKLYFLIPDTIRNYYLGIMLAWLRGKLKKFSLHKVSNTPHPSCINYILKCHTKDPDKFLQLVLDCRLFRGIHYTFIGTLISDFDRATDINGILYFRRTYKCCPIGEFRDVRKHFELVRKIQETVEKPFYKKVIANAISISNRNLNFVEDNFMCGTYGLRKAIWRFDIYNGGILASFIGNWINNSISEFQAHKLVRTPKDAGYIYGKLEAEMVKRKKSSVTEVAYKFGMSPEKARDLELAVKKEANIRLDIATQGVEDINSPIPEELIYTFDGASDENYEQLDYLLEGVSPKEKTIMCSFYGLFDKITCNPSISKEQILKEIKHQSEK